eukprot:jgi/Tetstr1/422643/TSEL_013449.t1
MLPNEPNLPQIQPGVKFCDYGTLPGYWDGDRYHIFNPRCHLKPYAKVWSELEVARDGDDLLLVGDSFDRQTVTTVSDLLKRKYRDYTPAPPSGRKNEVQLIGRNVAFGVGNMSVANMFIFGSNNQGRYYKNWKLGLAKGMNIYTKSRLCTDYKRYATQNDPYMIVLNSALWDASLWSDKYGNGKWKRGDFGWPRGMRPSDASQVYNPGPSGPIWERTLLWYKSNVARLIRNAKKCFPNTKVICWRTAPHPPTDSRVRHFWMKPPYMVAAFNNAAKYVAEREGVCVADMDGMVQGRANDGHWIPDGSHPSASVLGQYTNVLLNIMMQHKLNPEAHAEFFQRNARSELDEAEDWEQLLAGDGELDLETGKIIYPDAPTTTLNGTRREVDL